MSWNDVFKRIGMAWNMKPSADPTGAENAETLRKITARLKGEQGLWLGLAHNGKELPRAHGYERTWVTRPVMSDYASVPIFGLMNCTVDSCMLFRIKEGGEPIASFNFTQGAVVVTAGQEVTVNFHFNGLAI